MIQDVTSEITYIIILCLICQISTLPVVSGEPNFRSVLLEKPAIGGGGGGQAIHDLLDGGE